MFVCFCVQYQYKPVKEFCTVLAVLWVRILKELPIPEPTPSFSVKIVLKSLGSPKHWCMKICWLFKILYSLRACHS